MDNKVKNETFNYIDSGNVSHTVDIKNEDFDLVQVDKSIHDTKFKSKPTTFFKDALKRFSKNKASVAGGIILGILLLSSFLVPVIDRNPVEGDRSVEQFLPPKLFPTGTGFWDGTVRYENKVADLNKKGTDKNHPDTYNKVLPGSISNDIGQTSFNPYYISKLTDPVKGYTNAPTEFGHGGDLLLRSTKLKNNSGTQEDADYLNDHIVSYISPVVSFDLESEYTFTVDYNSNFVDDIMNFENGKYGLEIRYGALEGDSKLRPNVIKLTDFTNEDLDITLNEAIAASGLAVTSEDLAESNLVVTVEPSFEESVVVPIKTLETAKDGEAIEPISVLNPSVHLTYKSDNLPNYWTLYSLGNGAKALYQAECYYVSFTYDAYSATYSYKDDDYGTTELMTYVSKGLLPKDLFDEIKSQDENGQPTTEYIFNDAYLGFNFYEEEVDGVLYNNSPVVVINDFDEQQSTVDDPIVYTFHATSLTYKRLGYKSMPMFIFGTNQQGLDVFKIVFIGLRTSLLLGLFSAGICFIFGLCYGAISGYFGGTVDLVMQRFTDILSGVPRIVVMTLMILNFGQSFWVFAASLCLTGWIGTANLTRTQFYRFRGREYILASRTLGANDGRLIFRHILPNAMGTIITSSVLMIPSVVFSEATISYLGLGLKGMDSLGVILSDNQKFLQDYPNLLIVPAVVIALLMISFNLFGNGLRDAFNPSLKGSE